MPSDGYRVGRQDSAYRGVVRFSRNRSRLSKMFGWVLVGLGLLTMLMITFAGYRDLRLLPGEHDSLYFLLAVVVAAIGTWWLGLFDSPA